MSASMTSLATVPISAMSDNALGCWLVLRLQITPGNCLIVIADFEYRSWNGEDKVAILSAFKNMTGTDGTFVKDYALPRTFLGPVEVFRSQNVLHVPGEVSLLLPSIIEHQHSTPNTFIPAHDGTGQYSFASSSINKPELASGPTITEKIPRPPNAFILYRKFHHPSVVARNPGVHNNKISQIIGKMWSEESEEVSAEFRAQAEQAKLEHSIKYPNYQYQPRKPSEKKRRMTKKKAATLAGNSAITAAASIQQPRSVLDLRSSGSGVTSLLPAKRSKKRISKQNKRTNSFTSMAPQAITSDFVITEQAQLVDGFNTESFGVQETVGIHSSTTQTDEAGLAGAAGDYDDLGVIIDPENVSQLSPVALERCRMFAQTQGWYN